LPGGADISVEGLTWRPVRRRTPVLANLDLDIPAGQRVLVAGPSGAGKSTLLRAIAGLLLTAGHGEQTGRVRIGRTQVGPPADLGRPAHVGLLLQDPLASLVAETVGRDVAFGLENEGVPRAEIWPRVVAALRDASFPYDITHPAAALSGGEAQRLALAGNLVMGTEVTLLDEPTSMLDADAAESVRAGVRRDAARRGSTVVIVEHHLEPWLDFADRIVVLGQDGSVVADGPPLDVLRRHGDSLASQGVWVPALGPPQPLTVDADLVEPHGQVVGELVHADQVRVDLTAGIAGRPRRTSVALDGVSVSLQAGRALAVSGSSGAGKSTLIAVLAGLLRPTAGSVVSATALSIHSERRPWRWRSRDLVSRLSWAPQAPEHGVVARTVGAEVLASSRACDRDPQWADRRADGLLETLGLASMREVNPYHLSGGEQRRLMVAASLAHGPYGVMLDEPTVGQDRLTWAAVVGVAAAARSAGCGVAVASHDLQATEAVADDVLGLERGLMTS